MPLDLENQTPCASSTAWTPGSDEESSYSTDDEEDIECQMLEKERDEANQKLLEIEQVSAQLLKELDTLEMQFQIERSCRENAEAFAMKITKENKVLKRRSQALLPLIAELPENLDALTFDLENDLGPDETSDNSVAPELQWQAQVRDLQSSLDQLLGEKMQLSEQVEMLKREKAELNEQLAVEKEEMEALLRRFNKQSRTMHKVKRVSQRAAQEFSDITQRLQLEKGLRQHAEAFAHQMLLKQKETQRQSMILMQSTDTAPQLQQALQQVAHISSTLEEIRLQHQSQVQQVQASLEEANALSELQSVRALLEKSEEERRAVQEQLSDAQRTVTHLQEEVKQLQDRLKQLPEGPPTQMDQSQEEASTPAPPPPPPPPPPLPPPPSAAADPLDALRKRKKNSPSPISSNGQPSSDVKARAVEEMMERIKRGIVLRPTQRPQQVGSEDDSAWRDQNDKRKSAAFELQGMLESMKRPGFRRGVSRKRISRHVGEAELQVVLQRRRRAIGDEQGTPKTSDPQAASPANSSAPWAGENGAPVLRRLKQNREKRNSRIRASECIIWGDS